MKEFKKGDKVEIIRGQLNGVRGSISGKLKQNVIIDFVANGICNRYWVNASDVVHYDDLSTPMSSYDDSEHSTACLCEECMNKAMKQLETEIDSVKDCTCKTLLAGHLSECPFLKHKENK